MTPFTYARAASVPDTVQRAAVAGAKFLGGGTNLVDLMRETVERPSALIDVSQLRADIRGLDDGGLLIAAAVRNTAIAEHRAVRARDPGRRVGPDPQRGDAGRQHAAAHALHLLLRRRGLALQQTHAGPGLRRGRRLQPQPRDPRRVTGLRRDASVRHGRRAGGDRLVSINDLHRRPGERPDIETALAPGELITGVALPALPLHARSTYRKVRDRSSYAFALVSVAAALEVKDGVVSDVRIALGGVAHKPWRACKAEAALRGGPATEDAFRAAARAELADAKPLAHNAFKIELATRTVVAVLAELQGASA